MGEAKRYRKYCEDNGVTVEDHRDACKWLYADVPNDEFDRRSFEIDTEARAHHLTNAQAIVAVWKESTGQN